MADIFSRAGNAFGGSFAADAASVSFAFAEFADNALGGDAGGVGLLTQNLQFQYQQAVTRLYEIGTNLQFFISGRTQGTATLGRVLGPRPVQVEFYQKYGNVCTAETNNIDFRADTACEVDGDGLSGGVYSFKIKHCVITNIAVSVRAEDMVISENLQLMYNSLELGQDG